MYTSAIFPSLYIIFITILGTIILTQKLKQNKHKESLSDTSILEHTSESVIITNDESKIEFLNKSAQDFINYPKEKIIEKSIELILKQATPPNETISDNNNPGIQHWKSDIIDSNGNHKPSHITYDLIQDKSKKTIKKIFIMKDLSEPENLSKQLLENVKNLNQKKENLNQILQQSKTNTPSDNLKTCITNYQSFNEIHAKIKTSIYNLNLGFIMTDINHKIILHNRSAQILLPNLNIVNEDAGKKISLSVINENLNVQVKKSTLNKESITMADTLTNGRYVNIFISPIIINIGNNQDCSGAVIILEDKNDQHNLEQSKEDLFSIASHELRTPLTAIYGYISLIKQIYFSDLKNTELKSLINSIGLLSKKLSININNFLDSSKLEQGKIELKKEPCDLYTTINEAIKETERPAIEKNLYIKFDFPQYPISIIGDQTRLIQVFIILISNAIKFTQIGGIYIKAESINDLAIISFRDTGSGILNENKSLLFSKFQQADENLLTRQEGTGLGLHMAKLLIEKMGGSISLEKTIINKGSTFTIKMPLVQN